MLIDADLQTINAYGVLNEQSGKIPHPTAVVIDKQGVAKYVRVDEDYTVRPPTSSELVPALAAAGQ